MASPASVRLFSPFPIWLGLNMISLGLLASGGIGIMRIARAENDHLVRSQLTTLVKSHVGALNNGNYRDFVEGIGAEFSDLFVSINDGHGSFTFGSQLESMSCSRMEFAPMNGKPISDVARIQICRPFESPATALVWLLITFFAVSVGTAWGILRLERLITQSLFTFLKTAGVDAPQSGGLMGILFRVKGITSALELARRREVEFARAEAFGEMAAHVAHNIRSPVAALEAMLKDAPGIPAERRQIIDLALDRVRSIADKVLIEKKRLLAENRSELFPPISLVTISPQHLEPIDIVEVSRELISEKTIEFSGHEQLELLIPTSSESLFVFADKGEFKAVLSNLLNNAVESLPHNRGRVCVNIKPAGHWVEMEISDNGRGIPQRILKRLGRKPRSYGKNGGTGLGVYHAKRTIESWRGRLSISSQVQKGTRVTIDLPAINRQS